MLLAFDDTDSPQGGCTTRLALDVLRTLDGLGPRSMPRLVRLNPNVPWKTRGNAAVCLDLGPLEGAVARIGEWQGLEVRACPDAPPAPLDEGVVDAAWDAVSDRAQKDASPALAAFAEPPPAAHYWEAVRSAVDPADAAAAIEATGGMARGEGRALVGCLAAAAWPGPASSYEFIAYREPDRWGTPRQVDGTAFAALDSGPTFHCADPDTGRPACVPSTPCPVLFGLRGRDPARLFDAALATAPKAVQEPIDAWLLWATNQASGDHVVDVRGLLDAPEMATVQVTAEVVAMPDTRQGGHVFVDLEDSTGIAFQLAAFEPTHAFRDVVRTLRPGDRVTAVGAFDGRTLRAEKLRVDSVAEHRTGAPNPTCACGDRMKSKGAGQPHRCPSCGALEPKRPGAVEKRDLGLGWHEVPVMARRHLHRPVSWDD